MTYAWSRFAVAVVAGGLIAIVSASGNAQKGGGVSLPPQRGEAAWQSPWSKNHESTVRLIAGASPATVGQQVRQLAGVELRLNEGWKTYWRHPGDDGGLPPTFDWSGSRNLKAARVLYPAPKRLKSKTGSSIGYEGGVVFPVEIEPIDRTRPVELSLRLEYGICREICVPAEAGLQLSIDPALAILPVPLATALANVPVAADKAGAGEGLVKASAVLGGAAPGLTFDVSAGAGVGVTDLFVEAPEGVYLPMAQRTGDPKGAVQRFRIDLKSVDGIATLAGKPLRLTITGQRGGIDASWTVR